MFSNAFAASQSDPMFRFSFPIVLVVYKIHQTSPNTSSQARIDNTLSAQKTHLTENLPAQWPAKGLTAHDETRTPELAGKEVASGEDASF